MYYANDAKINLLSWIVGQLKVGEIIGTEVQFHDGRYRADLVIASPSRLCAIEIKGPRDDLRRLARQLSGYQRMYLEVYVAVTVKHINGARKIIPKSIGLILISENNIKIVRMPRLRKFLKKDEALAWLRTEDLREIVKTSNSRGKKTLIELRAQTRQLLSEQALSRLALKSVIKRLQFRFDAFQQERGKTITLDDLKMLQIARSVT